MRNIDSTIEQYLQGSLSIEEVKAFEQEMQSNPEIQSEVSMQKNIIEAIKQTKRLELKATLSQINPSYVSPLTQKIAIAAVSLLTVSLVSVGIYSTIAKRDVVEINDNIKTEIVNQEKNNSLELNLKVNENNTITSNKVVVEELNQSNTNVVKSGAPVNQNTTISKSTSTTTHNTSLTQKKNFDPIALSQDSDDDTDFSSKNGRVEMDKSANTIENSKVDYSVDPNYDFLGYKYDGKNLQLLGKFAGEAYIVEKKMNLLVLRYNNRIYQIIESNKVERLDKHQITNQKIIDQLK
jgi:hypothetical protein